MLNKKDFSLYVKELLAICGVIHKDSAGKELARFTKNEDSNRLVDSVFGWQDSQLAFTHNGDVVGEMVVFTTEVDGQVRVDLGVFNCQELYVPNMLHFMTSEDKDQENRASITRYLAILLKNYSISFIDPDSEESVTYEQHGNNVELAENLFMREISCISIVKEGVALGTIHFAGEYNDKRDWQVGDPYDFLDVFAFSSNDCRELLPKKLLVV